MGTFIIITIKKFFESILLMIIIISTLTNATGIDNPQFITDNDDHNNKNNFFSLSTTTSTNSCTNFDCYDHSKAFSCFYNNVNDNMYNLQTCREGEYCPIFEITETQSANCITYPPNLTKFSLPGELCSDSQDCMDIKYNKNGVEYKTGVCNNTKCEGSEKNDKCEEAGSCVSGLYCNSNDICENLIEIGRKCSKTTECVMNSICYNQRCVELFSLKTGTEVFVSDGENADSRLCISGNLIEKSKFAVNNNVDSVNNVNSQGTTYICVELKYDSKAHEIPKNGVIRCTLGSNCSYIYYTNENTNSSTSSTLSFTQKCVCGYDTEEKGYCPYALNEPSLKDRFSHYKDEQMKLITNVNNNTIHRTKENIPVKKRYQSPGNCIDMNVDVKYHNTNRCILKVLNLDYCEKISNEEYISLRNSRYISLALIGIFFVLFN